MSLKTGFSFRRGLADLLSLSSLHLEGVLGVVLLHYGDLFRTSEQLTGPFQHAIATMIPHRLWGACAIVVGAAMIVFSLWALFTGRSYLEARRVSCVAGFFLMGYLSYSCWKTDVPFDVTRIFYFWAGMHAATGVFLHLRRRADVEPPKRCNAGASTLAGEA